VDAFRPWNPRELMRNAYPEAGRRFDFPIVERNSFIDFRISFDPYPLG
jgi:hypothetical protein